MFSPIDQFLLTLSTAKWHSSQWQQKRQLHMETAIGKLAYRSCLYLTQAGLLSLLISVPHKSEITELKKVFILLPSLST